ncbi:probable disease resistance protein At4g27220 [Alnus glutinosa]|uniref:probable disease resistance protein At4g27220 n=1 Tax=Alnus glutinosa TaxID=3517 RepID=UPI002D772E51|nr:probable disease resistance protein At4g27220 [Alnus glutinosa]
MGNLCGTIAALFVEPIVAPIVAPISQWICYSFVYDSNIETLENAVETLKSHRERVRNSVDYARRTGEEIVAHDEKWLKNVDEIIAEAEKALQDEDRALTRCFNGTCLNLCQRHQLSRQAKKIVQVIDKLLEDGRWAWKHKDYVDFVSRMSTTKKLMEALGDANTNVIGVWGMAGVGKTTLVTKVAKQAKEKKLFYEVAMADVKQSPDLVRIQGQIADMLDLRLEAETLSGRADRLMKRLTKHKKILVILNDLWSKLDLEEIGIPSTGCKVVLTSRDKNLLSCEMGTHKDFEVKVLTKEEGWILFKKMAGDCVKHPNFESTAIAVAKECAGLPFALVTVSKALKGKDLHEWKDALRELKNPNHEGLPEMQPIYSSIELSYKYLGSKEVQHLFLLCAEMDYTITYRVLLKYCYGLGSFQGIDNLEQARHRLYSLVHTLKVKSLLLDCPFGSDDHCHMHDVVRDVATIIASRDRKMFVVRDNSGRKKLPEVHLLKTCTELSIPGGDIKKLPKEMECPELKFFYMHGGDRSLQIPDTFFEGMGNLQVLDLTKMKLPSLPSSLGLLTNLQALCLDRCVLEDITVSGKLKNLVILSLFNSDMSQLPTEIGWLTCLRLLDLSNCSKLEVIPPNLLSSLVELEELYMGNIFVQWEAEGVPVNERKNASLAELKHLLELTTLQIHIGDVENLPKDLSFENLKRYVIFVGDLVWDSSDQRKELRTLKLKGNTSLQSKNGIEMLLKGTEDLYIDELEDAENLLNESDREGFQRLKHLHIQNNPEIKYIINSRMSIVAFPALQTFILKNMTNLEEICHGQLPSTSFSNLKILKVDQCDKLKFVFSSSMAKSLSQLQELEVRKCSIMGTIVMKEEGGIEDTGTILFPKLIRLALDNLPKLMSFFSTQNPFITNAGEIISEGRLDFHIPILHEQVVFPILERLELSSVNVGEIKHKLHRARSSCKLINTQATSRFENLSYLQVQGSDNIKYLLTLSTARFMVQLKHLHIIECEVMKEILVTEESVIPMVLFPQLECIFLKKLPFLKRFCKENNIEFPSLKNLRIEDCPKFDSSGMKVSKLLNEMNAEESPYTVRQHFSSEEVNLFN